MSKTKSILYASIVASLAGFLFGFDTIVISGADKPIQLLWHTSDLFHGVFIMSMALWGTVIGALFGGIPCDKYGRRKALFWIGVLYFLSAVGSAFASGPYFFSFARFIGGLGVGASSVAAPIYISEITPPESRGRLVASYQFNIVFGILVAYVSNYLIGAYIGGPQAWRWMMAAEAVPAFIYAVLVIGVPESPRWLALKQNDEQGARALLQQLNPSKNIDAMMQSIKKSVDKTRQVQFFSHKFRFPIILAFLIAFFNQFSGINFVLYYAPRIFEQAGIASSDVLGASIPLGIVNLIFTLLGMYLIDKAGRKQLMYYGSFGYIFSLAGVSWAFFTGAEGAVVVGFVSAFIAAHAIGQGAVIWVFISEIFPNSVRDYGMSFGAGTHWTCAAVITLIMPSALAVFSGGFIFIFFSGMMVLQLLFVWKLMPETKNKSLEELEDELLPKDVEIEEGWE